MGSLPPASAAHCSGLCCSEKGRPSVLRPLCVRMYFIRVSALRGSRPAFDGRRFSPLARGPSLRLQANDAVGERVMVGKAYNVLNG